MKKITAFVLAITMVCSMLIVAHALEDRSGTYPCSCGGTVTIRVTTRTYTEQEECSHQSSSGETYAGYDIYRVTERTDYEYCDTCEYSYTDTRVISRELISCPMG